MCLFLTLGLHSIAKPKIKLFLPLISHYVIWLQELRQKLNKGGCGLGVVEKPLVNRIQCKQFGVIRLGNNNFRVIFH